MEEGDIPHGFVVQNLGLALVGKTCPHSPPTTGLQKGQCSGVSVGKQFFFWTSQLKVLLRHAYRRFRANIRKSDCVGPTLSNLYGAKLIPYWKKVVKANYANLTLFRTKVQMSTPFGRDIPWFFAHVFYMSIPMLDLLFFFPFIRQRYLVLRMSKVRNNLNWRNLMQKIK